MQKRLLKSHNNFAPDIEKVCEKVSNFHNSKIYGTVLILYEGSLMLHNKVEYRVGPEVFKINIAAAFKSINRVEYPIACSQHRMPKCA